MEKIIETCNDVLGPDGLIATRLKQYEHRPEQLVVASKVADAFRTRTHLAIEAGTGVGKSFAYLVPAILHVVDRQIDELRHPTEQDLDANQDTCRFGRDFGETTVEDENGVLLNDPDDKKLRRVVISTHTISLQEQLIEKDIPFLRSILPYEFSAVLVKGRTNYLCLRRLNQTVKRGGGLFGYNDFEMLETLVQWSKTTEDGSLSDLATRPKSELWNEISCEQGNCLGRSCPWNSKCFYNRARRRVFNSQVLVVNHAILFSDMALRRGTGGGILPNYDNLVIDEAHTIEQVAAEHLGMSISPGQVDYLLNRLYNERTQKGLLVEDDPQKIAWRKACSSVQDIVLECKDRSEELFGNLLDWLTTRPNSNGRIQSSYIVKNDLSSALSKLAIQIRNMTVSSCDQSQIAELGAASRKLQTLADNINFWFEQSDSEQVYWLEKTVSRRRERVSVMSAPIDVGPQLRENLFGKISSVIMTSATLTTGESRKKQPTQLEIDKAFTFFRSRIGLTSVPSWQVGSPFNYREQMTLVLPENLAPPEEFKQEYQVKVQFCLEKYLSETDGGAFVLFTNWSFLKTMTERLTQWLTEQNMPFFSQSDGMPRSRMIEEFKKNRRSVLFGTDSFWQGVDVSGENLRNVIITKLPFLVPSHPLTEARLKAIELKGGSAFRDYQLPHAILKFKQGVGRLIRSKTDSGLIVILDPRIRTKSYGKDFMRALPECKMRIDD